MGRASTTWVAVAAAACALLACAAEPPKIVPRDEAPAHDLVVRTEYFELHANAWIELHTWLFDRAGKIVDDAEVRPFADEVRLYGDVIAGAAEASTLDGRSVELLRACHDDRCASRALAATPFLAPYERALPRYLQSAWNVHARLSRAAVERSTPLLRFEVPLVDRLGKDLGIDSDGNDVPTRIDVVAHTGSRRADAASVLAADGACFRGDGILECALVAWAQSKRKKLAVGRAIDGRFVVGRADEVWSQVVAHAVSVTVREVTGRPSRLAGLAIDDDRTLVRWLAREWPKRRAGEPAEPFVKRLQDEAGDRE